MAWHEQMFWTHPNDTDRRHLQHIHLAALSYIGKKPAMECPTGKNIQWISISRIMDLHNYLCISINSYRST